MLFAAASFMAEAANGRAAASIRRWRDAAIDYFADADTRRFAETLKLETDPANPEARIIAAVRRLSRRRTAVVYGSPLESSPRLLRRLRNMVRIFGNDAETIRALRTGDAFFRAVRAGGGEHPRLANSPPADGGGWLIKAGGSSGLGSGGLGVTFATGAAGEGVCQRLIAGTPVSLNFLAARGRALPLVFSRSLLAPGQAAPFRLGGLVARRWPPEWRQLLRLARRLAKQFSLKGINTLDGVVAARGKFYALELNPRPGAGLRLLTARARGEALTWHIAACAEGKLPPHCLAARLRRQARGRVAIIYSSRSLTMPPEAKPSWAGDWPVAGGKINKNAPFCTIRAADARTLRRRRASVTAIIGL